MSSQVPISPEFRRPFRGSPILRAKRRGFLRNVAVALGNLKSRQTIPALIQALQDEEPLVRRHVAWALGEIGTADALNALRKRLEIEADAEVREEINEALGGRRQGESSQQGEVASGG